MSFRHGKSTALFLDSLDASPYFNTADNGRTLSTAEVTAFGAQGKAYIAGLEDATFNASGFFDGAVGQIDDRLNVLTTAGNAYACTYCPDGGAVIGRLARVFDIINTTVGVSSPVANATALKLSAQVTGGADWGRVLNNQTQLSATTTLAGVDWGATGASTLGGQMNVHVTFNTRSTAIDVKVQHSTDNSVWTDLAGAQQTVPAGVAVDGTHPFGQPTAYVINTAAIAVNRYLRAVITPTAGTGAISAVVAFARF